MELMSLSHGSHGTSYQKVRSFESLCNSSTNLKEESLDEALDTVEFMHQQGIPISRETMFSLLQKCMKKNNLLLARRVHSVITNTGFASVSIFHDHLIRLFAICGSLLEANQVFSNVAKPSAHTWYAIISAYTKNGEGKMALKLFRKMQQMDVRPGMVLFTSVLKACSMIGSFCEGRLLHNQIVEGGVSSDLMIGNTLVDMYAKCGSLEDAHKVFNIMVDRDVVSWNALISGYAQHGYGLLPLQLFEKMQGEGTKPCKVTYSSVLKACSNLGIIGNGKIIHKQIVQNRLESDVVIGNALVDMYAKCGILEEAQSVFDGLQNRTIVSWGAIIAGYASQGHGFLALDLFDKMLQDGIKPNRIMLSCILKACSSIAARDHGMSIHDLIIKTELESDVVIGNTVIDMYIRCGSIEDGHKVFTNLLNRDDVSWNAMIAGSAHQGYYLLALELFWKMQQDGIQPCKPLALCVLKACTTLAVLVKGMLLHELLVETGLESDAMIQNTLVDMYAKCGSLKDAQRIFDNLQDRNMVSWGAIISGYAAHGQSLHAFNLFARMQQEGKTPNDVIYLSTLRVCISIGDIRQGRFIHDQVIRTGLESALVVGNTLIDMYANCGSLDEGRRVFDALLIRDEVSWGVMLDGYAENKDGFLALELFEKMQEEGVRANRVIFSLILKSCGITGAVEQGRMVHDQIIEFGIELDIETGTTLIDMYGNCGSLLEAHRVLDMLPNRDASSWNALIAGYSQHGYAKLALQCLQDMQCQGFKPDSWTFTSILAACSHEGEVEKGYHIFTLMRHGHGITPTMEHFNCIVDILGRVGRLDEAEQLLRTMPKLPNVTGWLALLTACRTFGNNELGRVCFHEAVRLDAEKASGYMLMSNICADGHMWEDVLKIQEQRKYASAWKKPGRVWIQVKDKLQQFVVGDKNHLISDTITAKLNNLKRQLQEVGHMPQLDLVFEPGLHDDAMKK